MPFGQSLSIVAGAGGGLGFPGAALPGGSASGGGFLGALGGLAQTAADFILARERARAPVVVAGGNPIANTGIGFLPQVVSQGARAAARSPAVQGALGGLAGSMIPDLFGGGGGRGPMPGVRMSKVTPKGNPTNAIWLDTDFDDQLVFWKRVAPKGWKTTGSTAVTGRTRTRCRPR